MSPPRRRWTVCAAGVAALGAVIAAAAPAWAHAQLQGTDPAPEARLERPPQAITLRFDEPVESGLGSVRLFDRNGRSLPVGAPRHGGGRGEALIAPLPRLGDGTYVASYRVTSADGHPVRGAFVFHVGEADTSAAEARGLLERVLARDGGDVVVGAALGVARAVLFGSLLVAIGGLVFCAAVWPGGRQDPGARRIIWWSLAATALASVAVFALHGPEAAGLGTGHVLDLGLWRETLRTRTGAVTVARLALAAAAAGLALVLLRGRGPAAEHPVPVWWPSAAGLVLVGLAATPGWAGHAATGPWGPGALVIDAAHVLAAGVWLGGLVVILAVLLRRAPVPTLGEVLGRWSNVVLGVVVAVVATGSAQAVRQIGSLRALTDTDYGRLLVVKILVVLAIVVAAATARDTVDRYWRRAARLPARRVALVGAGAAPAPAPGTTATGRDGGAAPGSGPGPGGDGTPPGPDDGAARRRLRRSVGIETAGFAVVVALTALLVNAPPPRAGATGPFFETLRAGELRVDVNVIPARPGSNVVHFYAFTRTGLPTDVVEMTASLARPADGIEPLRVPLLRAGPGHYLSSGFTVPFAGDWTLTVTVVVDDVTRVSARTRVPVR